MSAKPFQELDALVARVAKAQRKFASYTQEQVDSIFCHAALAAAGVYACARSQSRSLRRHAGAQWSVALMHLGFIAS